MQRLSKPFIITGILVVGFGLVMLQIIFGQVTPALADGPVQSKSSGIAWRPCYYTDDLVVRPEQNREELVFLRQVDRQALTGCRLSPSYVREDTIVPPGPRPDVWSGIAWRPFY